MEYQSEFVDKNKQEIINALDKRKKEAEIAVLAPQGNIRLKKLLKKIANNSGYDKEEKARRRSRPLKS